MKKSALPIRSALEMLRLECPEYRIYQRVIGDRLFCMADAAGPGGLAHFLRDLDITEPGIVEARQWRTSPLAPGHRRGQAWAAVGRKSPAPPAGTEQP